MVSRAILSNFFEEQWTQNHPQYLSGLSRALLPTTFLEIAVYCRETSHEGPFKTSRVVIKRRKLGISPGYSKHGPWQYFQRKIQCRRKAWKIKIIFIISKWWSQVLKWQTTLISLHSTYNYSICDYLLTNSISVSNEIWHFTSFMTCTSRTIRQGPPSWQLCSHIEKIYITYVEGLNVIKGPKCNKVLNVITFCPKCNKLLSCKLQ